VAALLREAAEEGAVRAGAGEPEAAVGVGAIEGCLVQWVVDPEFPFAEIADQMVEVGRRGGLRGAAGGARRPRPGRGRPAEEGAVRAGAGEPEAAVVVGAIEGCLVQWVVDPECPFAEIADQMVEVCTRGVLRGAAGGAA